MARQGKRLTHAFRLPLVGVFLAVLFLSVSGWCACNWRLEQYSFRGNCRAIDIQSSTYSGSASTTYSCQQVYGQNYSDYGITLNGTNGPFIITKISTSSQVSSAYGGTISLRVDYCDNDCEAKEADCQLQGGRWEPSSDPDSCGKCIDTHCEDLQTQCEANGGDWRVDPNDEECGHVCDTTACKDTVKTYEKCSMTWNNGYLVDGNGDPGGGGYWQIILFNCTYDPCDSTEICTEGSKFPAGTLTCDDWQCEGPNCNNDTTKCIASIGHRCTIQCPNNVTKSCDCDGSCQNAMTREDCKCPEPSPNSSDSQSSDSNSSDSQSSDSNSSDSQSSDSQSSDSNSSDSQSSNSSVNSSGSGGGGNDWEYDYSQVLERIRKNTADIDENTNISAGYLSSIDRWQSTLNMNIQAGHSRLSSDISAAATQVASAVNGTTDTLHHTNSILESIDGKLSPLSDSVDVPDLSGWLDSVREQVEQMSNPETLFVDPDSLKNDTTQFKSKYSGLFLSGVYTRDGCYEFTMKKPNQDSFFGRAFNSDIVVNFGNLAGVFDMCAILRGIVRIAGAILVLLISIKSYKSAFSSSDG